MGFSLGEAQLLVAPPYVVACILMVIVSWVGDKYKTKAPIILACSVTTVVGLVIMVSAPSSDSDGSQLTLRVCKGYTESTGVRYFGVVLTAASANTNVPTVMAYQANNIRGQWKRAFCSATLVAFGGLGGIFGSLVFRTEDAPLYRPGLYAAIACNSLSVVIVVLLSIHFRRSNKLADQGRKIIEGLEGFRYTI